MTHKFTKATVGGEEVHAMYVEVVNPQSTTIEGGVTVGDVGLKNTADEQINPATSEKQDSTNAKLDAIDADTSAIAAAVSGAKVQVDIVTSALPSGAATEGTLETVATNTAPGAAITDATMPAGGAGFIGWLSAIWVQLSSKLPAPVSGRVPVEISPLAATNFASQADVQAVRDRLISGGPAIGAGLATTAQRVTLASDGPVVAGIGNPADAAATSDTGAFGLIALFKRALIRLSNLAIAHASGLVVGGAADNAAVTGTIAAPGVGKALLIKLVTFSFGANPSAARVLSVTAGAATLVDVGVTTGGPGPIAVWTPAPENTAVAYSLAASGTAGVTGRLRIYYATVDVI